MKIFTRVIVSCLSAAVMCGCAGSGVKSYAPVHDEADEHEDEHEHEDGVIVLTAEQVTAAGLKTETVEPGDFEESIRVSGQVTTSQGDEAAVTARSSGVVTFVRKHLAEGVAVTGGEVLAVISSASIEGGDAVAKQTAVLQSARAAYERAKALMADTLISRKEYERISQEYEVARLAAANGAESGGSSVVSPLTGYIRKVMVREGEYVQAGTAVAAVTKSCNLQLRAEVPEKYFGQIGRIRNACFEMSYGGGVHRIDSLHGHLVSVGQGTSEQSAYIPVTFEFVNDGCMVAGSFADIWLLTEKRSGVISVPTSAISEEQGIHYIYILLPEDEEGVCEFVKREVRLGLSNGQRTEVVDGVSRGDKVVTHGVTQVKLAGASGGIPDAHNHGH